MIDADALIAKQASIAKTFARSDAQKSLIGRVMYNTEKSPTIDAIPVKWLCEKIREEDRFGGIPFGEYLKVLIWEWHQQEDD